MQWFYDEDNVNDTYGEAPYKTDFSITALDETVNKVLAENEIYLLLCCFYRCKKQLK